MTIADLLRCSKPLLFEDGFEGYEYSAIGTFFYARYKGEYFAIGCRAFMAFRQRDACCHLLGVVSKTGVAGLTLGGGVGWLVRKYGLTCDNVLSFDIVTADGKPRDENQDLFWALRGGGGNFGVVTSFEFRAHPVSTILGGLIIHPRDRAIEFIRFYRDFTQTMPEELTAYAALVHTPDGIPAVAVIACYCGDMAEGEKVLKPLRAFGSPMADLIQPMPFPQMQTLLDATYPEGNYNYWKSTFLRELSDEAIGVLLQYANQAISPLTAVAIEYYGGAAVELGAMKPPLRNAKHNIRLVSSHSGRIVETRSAMSNGPEAWRSRYVLSQAVLTC